MSNKIQCGVCGAGITEESLKRGICLYCKTVLPHASEALRAAQRNELTTDIQGPTATIIDSKGVRVVSRDAPEVRAVEDALFAALEKAEEQSKKQNRYVGLFVMVLLVIVFIPIGYVIYTTDAQHRERQKTWERANQTRLPKRVVSTIATADASSETERRSPRPPAPKRSGYRPQPQPPAKPAPVPPRRPANQDIVPSVPF